MKQNAALVFALLLLTVFAGCTGEETTTIESKDDDGGGSQSSNSVEISNFAFSPAELAIAVGETVIWTNAADSTHTASADDGEFDSGNLANGESFSFTFDTAGTYAYHCNIHASMTGTITVEDSSGGQNETNETSGGNETNGGNETGGGNETNENNTTAQTHAVDISNFAFDPSELTIAVGDTVTWTNAADSTHTASADDGEFDSGNLANGESFSFTFDIAGTYAYQCNIHTSMKGTITVT